MLLLAERLGAVVFALPGGSVERRASELGLAFRPLNFAGLLSFRGTFITVRSRDTLMALLASLVGGSGVVRLDFVGRDCFWDRFLKKVPLERLGWVRVEKGLPKKRRGWVTVAVVSRLKPGRGLEGLFDGLSLCRLKFRLYVIGGGDFGILGGPRGLDVVWIKKKVSDFRRLLGSMDLLLYTSAGTDKSCRAVLEAMEAGVAVATMEPLSYRYVDDRVGLRVREASAVDRLLSVPKELKKRQLNSRRRAFSYDYRKVEVPF